MEREAIAYPEKESVQGKIWSFKDFDERESLHIQQKLEEDEIIARLLASRGLTVETAPSFLEPRLKDFLSDPSHLLDMDKGVQRILTALKNKEQIAIFGDYDVDGATSSALLYKFFSHLGVSPLIYIPDRTQEGYGPNLPALLSLKDRGVTLILTVDCGTTAHEPLEKATQEGLDIIVIDHHSAEGTLPNVHAVINPNRVDQESPCGHLAAVGVTFLLVVALNRVLRTQGYYQGTGVLPPDLLSYLDLVALGTVCDVVSLTTLNRAFVAQGLKVLAQRQNLGLRTLMDQGGVERAPTPYHLGFILGPRINAGGRVGKASLGSDLLTTTDSAQAQSISQDLCKYNTERKAIEAAVLEEAMGQVSNPPSPPSFICVQGDKWHPGVIGIVAGRLKDRFHRPTAVIAFEGDLGKASARSITTFNMGHAIQKAVEAGVLISGGGHPMAGGFTIERQKLTQFQDFMENQVQGVDLTPVLSLDGTLSVSGATPSLIEALDRLGPYGQGNPRPRFAIFDARLSYVDQVGDSHLRCTLQNLQGDRLTAMAFRTLGTPLGEALLSHRGQSVDVAGTLQINHWGGHSIPQLLIDDIRVYK